MELIGRRAELSALDALLSAVRDGHSRVLVLSGEAGIGKTALLDVVTSRVPDWQITRVAGIEAEMDFAYAALHQLCLPLSEHVDRLPAPQQTALATAFGQQPGATCDPFLVGLAMLNVVSESAQHGPVLLVIDDQQWLDRASSLAAAFVARRLAAEPVGVVFAARTTGPELRGLAELPISRLPETALTDSAGSQPGRPARRPGPRPDRRRSPRQPAGLARNPSGSGPNRAGRRLR
ncbi:ATP-binding protein [Mycobacterium sp. ZZG]